MTDQPADVQSTAPVTNPTTEPAAAAEAPTDYTAHPVWGKAIEAVPDILRPPIYEAIRTSERESQTAIERARGTDTPAEWRELAAEAQQLGVSVDDLAEAYRGQQLLAEQMRTDPDGFVRELQNQVDQLVASGQLTRREGGQVMQQANAAVAEQTDDLLTDEQKQLRELQAWKQQQEQAEQARRVEEQRQQEAARLQQEEEAASNAYFDAFDREMESAGFMARDAAGQLVSTIPVDTLQLIARTGAGLIDANPKLPREQAIKQATDQVRRMIETAGGRLAPANQRPTPPVIGASSSMPQGAPQQPSGPRTMAERMQAALAEATRLNAANG